MSSLNFLTEKILQLEADLTEQENTAVVTLNLWWVYALHEVFSLFSGSASFSDGNYVCESEVYVSDS